MRLAMEVSIYLKEPHVMDLNNHNVGFTRLVSGN